MINNRLLWELESRCLSRLQKSLNAFRRYVYKYNKYKYKNILIDFWLEKKKKCKENKVYSFTSKYYLIFYNFFLNFLHLLHLLKSF